jgi:hypothetical protein
MLGIARGTRVPARNRLFAFVVAAIAAAPIAARADDGLVDVRTLPRLEGAVENTARTEPHSLSYGVPTPVTVTTPAIEKLLAADGWLQYEASRAGRQPVPAELDSVLAFYRSELTKRGWKESAERAVVKPDQIQLVFSSPDGPALLKLGRSNGETTINLAQKIPAAAAKGDVMPKPGQAKLMFTNLGDGEAALTVNKQSIKIAAGAGGAHAKGPTLELPPGKYQYSLKVGGSPAQNSTIELAADDAWGLMIAPGGDVMPLQVY